MVIFILECTYFFLCISTHLCILVKKDENCRSIRTENSLALLIPNHFVLDDCPRDVYATKYGHMVEYASQLYTQDIVEYMPQCNVQCCHKLCRRFHEYL